MAKKKPKNIVKSFTVRFRLEEPLWRKLDTYIKESESYETISVFMRTLVRDRLSGKLIYKDSVVLNKEQLSKLKIINTMKEIFDTGIDKITKTE